MAEAWIRNTSNDPPPRDEDPFTYLPLCRKCEHAQIKKHMFRNSMRKSLMCAVNKSAIRIILFNTHTGKYYNVEKRPVHFAPPIECPYGLEQLIASEKPLE